MGTGAGRWGLSLGHGTRPPAVLLPCPLPAALGLSAHRPVPGFPGPRACTTTEGPGARPARGSAPGDHNQAAPQGPTGRGFSLQHRPHTLATALHQPRQGAHPCGCTSHRGQSHTGDTPTDTPSHRGGHGTRRPHGHRAHLSQQAHLMHTHTHTYSHIHTSIHIFDF